MIKLVVSDMDGTLLNRQSKISINNLKAIQLLHDKGIQFAIASGRDYYGVYSIIHDNNLQCQAVLGNGAQYVNEEGKLLLSSYLNKLVIKDIVNIFMDEHIPFMIYTTKGFYTTYSDNYVREEFILRCIARFDELREDYDKGGRFEYNPCNQLKYIDDLDKFLKSDLDIIKIEAFNLSPHDNPKCFEALKEIKGISYLSSFDDNCEVCDQYAQKGLILRKVIQLLGIEEDEVAVIGDGMNDLTMFENFKYGFAMGNAEEIIKELAYCVVGDCDCDGFSEAVMTIIDL